MIRNCCCGILAAVLLVSACSPKQEKRPPVPPIKVGVVSVVKGDVDQMLHVSGPLTFVANTTVSAEVSAQVQSIEVQDGQPVEEGQLLLVFDETKIRENANQARANLQRDEALLAFHKAEWDKHLSLFKTQSISQTAHDQKLSAFQTAQGQVEADRAALAKALEDLNDTKVRSPIKGILSRRFVERGDWVSEGANLFQISDYTRVYLEAFISDMDVGKLNIKKVIQEGIDADFTVDSYPGRVFKGKLTYIQPVANEARLFQIRIYIDNPELLLLQGMFARGRVVFRTISDVLRIPLDAVMGQVRNGGDNSVVIVDQEKKARFARIKIGATNDRWAEVVSGLKEGDMVVTTGREILSSGQPVEPTEMPGPQERGISGHSPPTGST